MRRARQGSEAAHWHVYERLYFNTEYNFETYQKALETVGFKLLAAQDLSDHRITSNKSGEHADHYGELSYSYEQTAQAVVNDEGGWGLFLCQK